MTDDTPTHGMNQETFDEIEAATRPPVEEKAVVVSTLPKGFEGMTAEQIAERASNLSEALRISEDARRAATHTKAVEQAPPVGPKLLTEEDFRTMYENDPFEAQKAMISQAAYVAQQQIEQRLRPLGESSRTAAELSARATYKEDFELFGAEIMDTMKQIDAQALSNPTTIEQIVTYVRGKPANIDKLIAHRTKSTPLDPPMPSLRTTVASKQSPKDRLATLRADPTVVKVCEVMNMSLEDYAAFYY